MATNYPGALDSLTNPAAGDALTSPSHSAQHANANDAIEAIETELGTNPSGSESTVAARLTGIENGTRLAANSVGATQLADSAVDTAAIADGAVTPAKLATTGRFTFPTGAANGYGFTSGAVHLSGTGTPEGVVTAAPGSTWLQTDATTDVKGWLRWVKATGTGNTGWIAGPEADTGWRSIPYPDGLANWTANSLLLRRQGSAVTVVLVNVKMTAIGPIYALPTGFRAKSTGETVGGVMRETQSTGNPYWFTIAAANVCNNGAALAGSFQNTYGFNGAFPSFITADAWPASLPGSAA